MSGIVNRIGEAEQERLGLFCEETGEANQIVGKILRHGLDSTNPDSVSPATNAEMLERECGDILAALELLVACGTLDRDRIKAAREAKLQKLRHWLHCGTNLDAVEELLKAEELKAKQASVVSAEELRTLAQRVEAACGNHQPAQADCSCPAHQLYRQARIAVFDRAANAMLERRR